MNPKKLIKLVISLLMLALVVRVVDLQRFVAVLRSIPPLAVVTVVIGYALGQLLSAWKWWLIARASNIPSSLGNAIRAYFIGMYVNCFGFGIVGGDLTRGVMLAGAEGPKAKALATVVADRAHGLAVLAFLGTCSAALLGSGASGLDPLFRWLLAFIAMGVAVGWIAGPKLIVRLCKPDSKLGYIARDVSDAFPRNPRSMLAVTLISVAFHILQIALHAAMAWAVSAPIPMTVLLIAIPFVNILSSLPISWQGLGVRENAYAFFLVPAYLSYEQTLAFGAIWLLAVTASSAIGGVVSVMSSGTTLVVTERLEPNHSAPNPATPATGTSL